MQIVLRIPAIIALAGILPLMPHFAPAQTQELTPEQEAEIRKVDRDFVRVKKLYQERKYEEALQVIDGVLATCITLKGEDSIDYTVRARFSRGGLLFDLGRAEEARVELEKVLQKRKEVLGERHLETADAAAEFGNVLRRLGQPKAALPLLEQALDIYVSHKDTNMVGWAYSAISNAYLELHDYDAAVLSAQRSLDNLLKSVGEQHFLSANALDLLGLAFMEKTNFVEARRHLERALAIRQQYYGPDHPETSTSYNNVGKLLSSMGQYQASCEYYERALAIAESSYGPDHPITALQYANLGSLLGFYLGKHEKARKYLEKALSIRSRVYGDEHPTTAHSHALLAMQCKAELNETAARTHYEAALKILRKTYGDVHPDTATVLNNLSTTLDLLGDIEAALDCIEETLQIRVKLLGNDHLVTAKTVASVAYLLEANRRTAEAIDHYDLSRRVIQRYVATQLPSLSAAEQIQFLAKSYRRDFQAGLQIAWLHREDAAIASCSAQWLLNGKAVSQESLAARTLAAREARDPQSAETAKELLRIRQQLARLAFSTPAVDQLEQHRKRLSELEAAEQQLSRRLGLSQDAEWVELAAIRDRIPNDAVFVDIARFEVFNIYGKVGDRGWLPARYAAWITPAAGRGDVQIIDLGEAEPIDKLITDARQSIAATDAILNVGEIEAEKRTQELLSQLSRGVLEPIVKALPNDTQRLLLSPDASLWLVPWAALPLSDGRYAVEQYEIQYLVSGRDLLPNKQKVASVARPIIFADPNFDLSPRDSLAATKAVLRGSFQPSGQLALRSTGTGNTLPKVARLPGTAVEARAVSPKLAEFAGAEPILYMDKYAQEGVFKAIARPQTLVLSTHGFFLKDQESQQAFPLFRR